MKKREEGRLVSSKMSRGKVENTNEYGSGDFNEETGGNMRGPTPTVIPNEYLNRERGDRGTFENSRPSNKEGRRGCCLSEGNPRVLFFSHNLLPTTM